MKLIKTYLPILLLAILVHSVGCGKLDDETLYVSKKNTMVSAFALKQDTNVLKNLEYIFFTIDLVKGEIFNADSLPKGTDVSAIAVNASFKNASNVVINYNSGGEIKSFGYLEDSTVKIDFRNSESGGVKMTVTASDGYSQQTYLLKVNVHKVVADSLYWEELEQKPISQIIPEDVKEEKSIKVGDEYYMFYEDAAGVSSCIKTVDFNTWQAGANLTLPSMKWRTLISDGTTLYVISQDGRLFSCNDLQNMAFTENSLFGAYTPYSLIGFYQESIVAVVKSGDNYMHAVANPASGNIKTSTLNPYFPVSGFSSPVTLTSKWGAPQLIIACGMLSDGTTMTNAVWGFDGSRWAILNNITEGTNGSPITPRVGATLFQYYTYTYDTIYDVHTKIKTYFMIGGLDKDGATKDLYYTNDMGGAWNKAGEGSLLRLPDAIKPRMFADAFIIDKTTEQSSKEASWIRLDVPSVPKALTLRNALSQTVTTPYIYMVGGSSLPQYGFINEVWSGVMLRLIFPPIE